MREWRNWQTRTFEGRVVHTVRVQVPFLAPEGTRCEPCTKYAGMAELADALDSGSSGGNFVEVQVLLPAPKQRVIFRSPFLLCAGKSLCRSSCEYAACRWFHIGKLRTRRNRERAARVFARFKLLLPAPKLIMSYSYKYFLSCC